MLTFKLQESLESATEKLRVLKQSIVGRTATASEVNQINKYEDIIYKYNKEEEDIKRRALDKSVVRLNVKIEGKNHEFWVDRERYNNELDYKVLQYDCMWNNLNSTEVLQAIEFSKLSIGDFNKLTTDEKNVIIDNYKNKKI